MCELMIERNTDTVDVESGVGNMEHNAETVIASTMNYILNQHSTAKTLAEAIEQEEDRAVEYYHLQGAMAAWYYVLEAIKYFISIHMFEDEEVIYGNADTGASGPESSRELHSELLQESTGEGVGDTG